MKRLAGTNFDELAKKKKFEKCTFKLIRFYSSVKVYV